MMFLLDHVTIYISFSIHIVILRNLKKHRSSFGHVMLLIVTRALVKSELDCPALIKLLDVGVRPRDMKVLQKSGWSTQSRHTKEKNTKEKEDTRISNLVRHCHGYSELKKFFVVKWKLRGESYLYELLLFVF